MISEEKRACVKCFELKPITEFNKGSATTRRTMCNICQRLYYKHLAEQRATKRSVEVQEKKCAACQIVKPRSSFWKSNYNLDGLTTYCKECHPEKVGAKTDKRRDYQSNYDRTKKEELYEKGEAKAYYRRRYLRQSWGISVEEFEKLAEAQNYKCAICGKSASPDSQFRDRTLFIDHDHATGKIRELLCNGCNRGLGFFQDDKQLVAAALAYLKKHSDEQDE